MDTRPAAHQRAAVVPKKHFGHRARVIRYKKQMSKNDPQNLLALSDEQASVVDAVDFAKSGINSVTACAGAGKTRTLSHLVVKALRHVVADAGMVAGGSKVMLLTATRASKDEAQARVHALQECMYQNDIDTGCPLRPESVRTVHSLALKLLKDSNPSATVQIVSTSDIRDILEDILQQVNLKACKSNASQDLFASLDRHEQAGVLAEMRAERLKKNIDPIIEKEPLGPLAGFALKELEKQLDGTDEPDGPGSSEESSLVPIKDTNDVIRGDFNTLIYGLANIDGAICKEGDILFVDECQDLNRCQMEIVLKAAEYGACVVVLGDDSQGIFHFSGAVDRTMHSMAREAEQRGITVFVHKLLTNFRSSQQIVEVSEALLPEEDRQWRRGTRATHDGHPVQLSAWETQYDEGVAVASKIVQLVCEGTCLPGEIVVLRHANWNFSDTVITQLAKKARERGAELPHVILGKSGSSGSLTFKLLSSVTVLCGVQRFGYTFDVEDEAFDLLQVFLRSIKGSTACTDVAKKALIDVFQGERLVSFFDLLTLVDTDQGKAKLECAFRKMLKEDDAKADSKASAARAKGVASKKRKTDQEAIAKAAESKLVRFLKGMESASHMAKAVQTRFEDVALGNIPLCPIRPVGGVAVGRQQRLDAVGQWVPKFLHLSGGLVWIVARDVLDIKWTADLQVEFDNLITKLDVQVGDDGDVAGALVSPICRVFGELNDKETSGKLIFSTIHRYKGKERPAAFVLSMLEPYSKITDAQAATLFQSHDDGCLNLHGNIRGCSCRGFILGLSKMHKSQRDEKRKLGYVAASRARERLYLSTVYGDNRNKMLAELQAVKCSNSMKEQWASVISKQSVGEK